MGTRARLVTAEDAALHLHRLGVRIKPGTIRQWARRGKIATNRQGWRRYDLNEVEEYARQRGYLH
jgi:predicted site-specific integrase-resolvase